MKISPSKYDMSRLSKKLKMPDRTTGKLIMKAAKGGSGKFYP